MHLQACLSVIALLIPLSTQAQTPVAHGGDVTVTMPGLVSEQATEDESAEIEIMFRRFETLSRVVERLPDGIRTVTLTTDPEVEAALVSHVDGMVGRVTTGEDPKIPIQSPTLDILFLRGSGIDSVVEPVAGGVALTQTSADPEVVQALHRHADEVTDFVERGMVAVHERIGTHNH